MEDLSSGTHNDASGNEVGTELDGKGTILIEMVMDSIFND